MASKIKTKHKLLSLVLTLCMVCSLMPMQTVNVFAEPSITPTELTNSMTVWNDSGENNGYYQMSGENVTISDRVTVSGRVNVSIAGEHTLALTSGIDLADAESSLTFSGEGTLSVGGLSGVPSGAAINLNGGSLDLGCTYSVITAGPDSAAIAAGSGVEGVSSIRISGVSYLTSKKDTGFSESSTIEVESDGHGGYLNHTSVSIDSCMLYESTNGVKNEKSPKIYAKNGSWLSIDDITVDAGATLTITEGSIFHINSGKTLTVNGNVVVENGGVLAIHNGATASPEVTDAKYAYRGTGHAEVWSDATFHMNGGSIRTTGDDIPVTSLTADPLITHYTESSSSALTLPTMEKSGYNFDGWCSEAECTSTPIQAIPANTTGAVEYWAKYSEALTLDRISSMTYNGNNQLPTLSATKGSSTLNASEIASGYDISYEQYQKTSAHPDGEFVAIESTKVCVPCTYRVTITNKTNSAETTQREFNINKGTITVSGITVKDKVYDGTTNVGEDAFECETGVTLAGCAASDATKVFAAIREPTSCTYASADVADNIAVDITDKIVLTGVNSAYYNLDSTHSQTEALGSITPATITIHANNKTIHVGDALPDMSVLTEGANADYTISGLVGSETYKAYFTFTYNPATPDTTQAGTADIVININESTQKFENGGKAINYNVVTENGTLTIEPAAYTISFAANGGTGTMNDVSNVSAGSYTLPENGFTAPFGQRFKAWRIASTEYAAGATVTISGDTTVTAVWENIPAPTTYTVSFAANGGTGTMAAITGVAAGSCTLPENGFTAPHGQRFKAWRVNSTEYAAGATITISGDTTVTAIWENIPAPTTYSVSFEANGGTGTMSPISINGSYTLPSNSFNAPNGKRFKAWRIGQTEYAAGDSVTISSDTVVTAVWEDIPANTFTVSFNANGGTGTMSPITGVRGRFTLPSNRFTSPAGKSFKGWSVNSREYAVGDVINVTANTTVSAVWETATSVPTTFTVRFAANGGTGTMDSVAGVAGSYKLPTNGFTAPKGKIFKDWSVDNIEYLAGSNINVAKDTTVTAVWEDIPPEPVTIAFSANGGSGSMNSVTVTSKTYILPACSFTAPDAKRFKAWKVGTTEYSIGDTIALNGNTTVTAVWEGAPSNSYVIAFSKNGGAGVMENMVVEKNDKVALTKNAFTSEGAEFLGWAITPNGQVEYRDGQYVIPTSDMVLYAVWDVKTYTISFETGLGGTKIDPITKAYGAAVVAPDDPVRPGYKFDGWNQKIPSTMPATNMIISAKWTQNESSGSTGNTSNGTTGNTSNGSTGTTTENTGNGTTETKPAPVQTGVEKTTQTDGSVVETKKYSDGSTVVTSTKGEETVAVSYDKNGKETAMAVAVSNSTTTNGKITVNTTAGTVPASSASAIPVTIDLPEGVSEAVIEIPAAGADVNNTVIAVVDKNGNETILKSSTVENGKITFKATDGMTFKTYNNAKTFDDVKSGQWYTDTIAWATSHEVMNGVGDNKFDLNSTTNRAMMVQMLFNIDGRNKTSKTTESYSDVSSEDWYADSVAWATANGIANGKNGSFGATDVISREDVAVMMYNYAVLNGCNMNKRGNMAQFKDVGQISDYAQNAMEWAVAVGLMNGRGDGVLAPKNNITRAEVATIMQRLCVNILGNT